MSLGCQLPPKAVVYFEREIPGFDNVRICESIYDRTEPISNGTKLSLRESWYTPYQSSIIEVMFISVLSGGGPLTAMITQAWARSPDLLPGRCHSFCIEWTGDSSLTQHTLSEVLLHSFPIFHNNQVRPFLPGIGRGQHLMGLMVHLARWTWVKTTGTLQDHLWISLGSCSPTLDLWHGPSWGSGALTCHNWDFHNHHLGEDRISPKTAHFFWLWFW